MTGRVIRYRTVKAPLGSYMGAECPWPGCRVVAQAVTLPGRDGPPSVPAGLHWHEIVVHGKVAGEETE